MAYAPGEGLQDFFGGQADLSAGVIRAVGEADRRFQEDALRILRAIRFASVLGFELDPETDAAARRNAPLLQKISVERVFVELSKLLCGPGAGNILRAYPDILGVVLPELTPTVGFAQHNIHHCYDVYTHTAVAVDHVPPEVTLRRNRETLYNGLKELGFECIKPEGAFYLFVKSPVADEKEFCNTAKKYNILIVPGSSFGCPGYVRMAYCVAYETIVNVLPKFAELAREYR